MIKVVHVKREQYDVYIGRANGTLPQSKWANPWVIGKDGTREEVIAKYADWIKTQPDLMAALPELHGKRLGCWCAPNHDCHGNVLARLVEELEGKANGWTPAPQEVAAVAGDGVFVKQMSTLGPVEYIELGDAVMPVFSSMYSYNQSVLTLEEAGKTKPGNAPSIVDLALESGFKQVVLVDDRMDGWPEAQKNLSKAGIALVFGLKLCIVPDMTVKTPQSETDESNVIVFMRDAAPSKGISPSYIDLIKIHNRAWTVGRFNKGRLDWRALKELWTPNLVLALPFFSSFISRNLLTMASIIPDLPCAPQVFREIDSQLPFASLIDEAIDLYVASNPGTVQPVKSIYYRDSAAFEDYTIFRARSTKSRGKIGTFSAPGVDNLASDRFSLQAWKELTT